MEIKGSDFAYEIANHHDGKHFYEQEKEWLKLGIKDLEDFADHIKTTIDDKSTERHKGNNSRIIHFNERSKILIITDPTVAHKGTAYFAKDYKRLKRELIKEKFRFNKDSVFAKNKISDKKGHRATNQIKKIQKRNIDKLKNARSHQEKLVERKQKIAQAKAKKKEAKAISHDKKARIKELQKNKEKQDKLKLEQQKKKEAEKQNQPNEKNKRLDQLKKNQQQKQEESRKTELQKQKDREAQDALERERMRQKRIKELEEARMQKTKDITKDYFK